MSICDKVGNVVEHIGRNLLVYGTVAILAYGGVNYYRARHEQAQMKLYEPAVLEVSHLDNEVSRLKALLAAPLTREDILRPEAEIKEEVARTRIALEAAQKAYWSKSSDNFEKRLEFGKHQGRQEAYMGNFQFCLMMGIPLGLIALGSYGRPKERGQVLPIRRQDKG